MTREEASFILANIDRRVCDDELNEALDMGIKALEQEPCDDVISRQAVEDKLLKLCNELEVIFADIRMKEGDDCVCGLCEYDCDHGIDGSAFECPGFETDECFKLADEIRHEWQSTKGLPSVNPQPCEELDFVQPHKKIGVSLSSQPKTGHWIEIAKYSDGNHKIECSECESHIFDRGHANSYNVKNKYKYCPNCGAKMIEPQESEVQDADRG